jgi:hypothetical protein
MSPGDEIGRLSCFALSLEFIVGFTCGEDGICEEKVAFDILLSKLPLSSLKSSLLFAPSAPSAVAASSKFPEAQVL